MEHAIEAINSGVTDKYKMIICVASIAEAKQLVDGCPQITSINLGNTKSKDEQRPDARTVSYTHLDVYKRQARQHRK